MEDKRKKCSKCGSWKLVSEFQPRNGDGSKLRNECRDCLNAYHRMLYSEKVGKFKREVKAELRESDPKMCIRCGQMKSLSEFGFHNLAKGQHRNFCKLCQKEWDSIYKKGVGKPLIDEWKENNKDKMAAYKEMYKKDPSFKEKMKRHGRNATLRQFGITQEDYDKILQEQDGKCAICGVERNGSKENFCVDHDHETGKVRGLLCTKCNLGIGKMKDSPDLLRKAAKYLDSFNSIP